MENLNVLHPEVSDAEEITQMIIKCDIADHGVPDITLSDLIHMWSTIDIKQNAWVVCSIDQIVGYAFLDVRGENRMDTCVFLHPDVKNQGIGSLLLSKVEERANELTKEKEIPQQLMIHIPFANEFARELVKKRGYEFRRLYQRMKIVLDEQPRDILLGEGIRICQFQPGNDENTLYEVYSSTFQDSWGYSKKDPIEWVKLQKGEEYDPSLWFIVWDREKPAAFMMSRMQEDGLFVDYLGVKREWRKQGIGLTLLHHAFQTAYQKGQKTILLYVDTDSLTNAQRLYSKAGMSPDIQTAIYKKEIHVIKDSLV